jgi:hypothetical protein
LVKIRYDAASSKGSVKHADEVLNLIMQLNLPEVDKDMYNARFDNISAWDYAL